MSMFNCLRLKRHTMSIGNNNIITGSVTMTLDTDVQDSGWISVKDRLPDKTGYYLVYDKENTVEECLVDKFFESTCDWDNCYPTHWQALPKPPDEKLYE